MERMLCLLLFIFIPAVLPVTAQSVTLSTEGPFVENSPVSFLCQFTSSWDPSTLRIWIGPDSISLITNGVSTNTDKYSEDVSNAIANHYFSMTIQNYNSADEGLYQCQYGFSTSNFINVSISNTQVHPVSSPLTNLTIPTAGEAIGLTFSVPGIRPAARVSFNLTSTSTHTSIVSDDANITNVHDVDGRTVTSFVEIGVPGRTEVGDILTITLMVGTYIDSRRWTVEGVDLTICTDRADLDGITNVLPMCRSGTLTVDRVVVDTYDTGVLGYDSCHCTVRLAQIPTDTVGIETTGYPDTAPTAGCGSKLRFNRLPGNTFTEFNCQPIPGDIYRDIAIDELVNITLSRVDNNIQWNSGYCIFIRSNTNIIVTCEAPKKAHTSSTIRMTTISSTPPIPTTTFTTTPTSAGMYGPCKCDEPDLNLVAIIVPIVVSVLVVTVGTVANIFIYKRRVAVVNKPKSSTSGMTTPDTVHYDSLDQSRVELPNTYEEISTRQTYVNMAMETK